MIERKSYPECTYIYVCGSTGIVGDQKNTSISTFAASTLAQMRAYCVRVSDVAVLPSKPELTTLTTTSTSSSCHDCHG